jgi:hypothetical protein
MSTQRTQDRPDAAPARPRPDEGGPAQPAHRRRPWMAAAAGAAAVALAAVLAVVFVDGDGGTDTTATTEEPVTQAPTTAAPATEAPATTAEPATSPPAGEPVLADGRHPVYLTALDVAAGTVEFDLIQFLGGAEAEEAYHRDNPNAPPGGPPNDYYIVNENPRLRVLPVAEGAAVTVLDWNAGFVPRAIAFADLPAALADDLYPDDGRLWPTPFWVTVEDGTVTAMEEQFIP